MKRIATSLFVIGVLVAGTAWGNALEVEEITTEVLSSPSPHWVWINDINILGLNDTKAYLFDGDSGEMLGMIPTGVHNISMLLSPDRTRLYSPETYYPRGTRGERSDYLIVRDMKTLEVVNEIKIPAKRSSGMPHRAYHGISDDGRFVYVNNMTPATSTSVVDVDKEKFVDEIEKAGCNLIYPTGDRSYASLCGDGTVQHVILKKNGKEDTKVASAQFFDPRKDPLREGGVRDGDTWHFVSFQGQMHPVTFGPKEVSPGRSWSLFSDAERKKGWKATGSELMSLHRGSGQLYVVVSKGGEWTHKNPGSEVWVYDLKTRKKKSVIKLESPSGSINVSQDDQPLLFAAHTDESAISIHDARTGKHLRTIHGPPFTPTLTHPMAP